MKFVLLSLLGLLPTGLAFSQGVSSPDGLVAIHDIHGNAYKPIKVISKDGDSITFSHGAGLSIKRLSAKELPLDLRNKLFPDFDENSLENDSSHQDRNADNMTSPPGGLSAKHRLDEVETFLKDNSGLAELRVIQVLPDGVLAVGSWVAYEQRKTPVYSEKIVKRRSLDRNTFVDVKQRYISDWKTEVVERKTPMIDTVFVHTDTSFIVDKAKIKKKIYLIGTYEYSVFINTTRKVARYTDSKEHAAQYLLNKGAEREDSGDYDNEVEKETML